MRSDIYSLVRILDCCITIFERLSSSDQSRGRHIEQLGRVATYCLDLIITRIVQKPNAYCGLEARGDLITP